MQSLTVPADLDSLDTITEYVQAAARQAGLSKKASYNLCLAVDEVATNIINYGYTEQGLEGNLDLEVTISAQALYLSIQDDSHPYDLTGAAEPDLTLSLEQRPIGGLGLFLARRSVDKLSYQRLHNRNYTTFEVGRIVEIVEKIENLQTALAS
jgi:anti-sigma regulatory factor (Ser/Thr protein kinase)